MMPRPSNLTGTEIYNLSFSRNPTPRGSNFNPSNFYSMMRVQGFNAHHSNFEPTNLYSVQSSRGPTPQPHPQPNTVPSSEMQRRRMPNLALSWFFCLSECHFKIAKRVYGSASQSEDDWLVAMNFVFFYEGHFNRSSLNGLGRNSLLENSQTEET
ncbi:hypothetical protein FF1_043985 [Malus domestica]